MARFSAATPETPPAQLVYDLAELQMQVTATCYGALATLLLRLCRACGNEVTCGVTDELTSVPRASGRYLESKPSHDLTPTLLFVVQTDAFFTLQDCQIARGTSTQAA